MKKPKDLDQPVTRREFLKEINAIKSSMLTKDDAKNFATKDDFNKLSLRILKHDEEIKRMHETLATKEDVQMILSHIDSFMLKNETTQRKTIVQDHRIEETEEKIADHEQRILALEKRA